MAGGEDSNVHDNSPPSSPTPAPSPSGTQNESTEPIPIRKTGEIMLGFALAIIFLVVFCIIVHLLLKQHRQKYPNGRTKKKNKKQTKTKQKAKDLEKGTVELHSIDRKVFEAAGTQVVLCELPEDAPPRHELDAGYVLPVSPLERTFTGTTGATGTTASEYNGEPLVSPADPLPDQHLAVYWQSR